METVIEIQRGNEVPYCQGDVSSRRAKYWLREAQHLFTRYTGVERIVVFFASDLRRSDSIPAGWKRVKQPSKALGYRSSSTGTGHTRSQVLWLEAVAN